MKLIRSLAERLSRNRMVWRRLPNGTRLAVSPDAQLKYLRGRFDEDLIALARDYVSPGAVVWDIGANCGTFAFSCDAAAEVVAVEADAFLAGLLRKSAARSGSNVVVVEAAVSDVVGTAEFIVAARGRASNHLSAVAGYSQTGGVRERVTVPTITLDSMLAERGAPDLVKIDIEGSELELFSEATDWLRRVGVVVLELHDRFRPGCRAALDRAIAASKVSFREQHRGEDAIFIRNDP